MLVGSRALAVAQAAPNRIALDDGTATLSYADLAALIGDATSPDVPGTAAALEMDGSVECVARFLALAMAGWAVATIDPGWTPAERAAALAQLGPTSHAGSPNGTRQPPDPRSDFYIGFTSGSSGAPKAFARSHASWTESFAGLDLIAPIGEGAVAVPGALSSSHFLFGALYGLHLGATVELSGRTGWHPARLAARIVAGPAPAAVFVVPSMARQLAEAFATRRLEPMTLLCAGARLDTSVRALVGDRMPGATIVEYYGASELSFVAIRVDGDGTPDGSVGRAFPGVTITIRDTDGRRLPAGAAGVIFVNSPLVFSGYRGVVPASAALRNADEWSVGDIGVLDDAGYLSVAGRGSSMIITGGANVQPEEVEAVLAELAQIGEVAVVGLDDERAGQVPVAVLTLPDGHVTRATLREHVSAHLAPYKRPRRYVLVDGPLPVGRTGKIDRDAVVALLADGGGTELR